MKRWMSVLLLLLARVAFAVDTPYFSAPVFVAGTQGRPIPNAQVSVTDLNGVPVVVYSGPHQEPFSGIVPVSQIVQFWTINAGEFIVTVQGQGLTKKYWTSTGFGFGKSTRIVPVSRSALNFNLAFNPAPLLSCLDTGKACRLVYDPDVTERAEFDFLLPEYQVTFDYLLLDWYATGSPGTVVWEFDWCAYAEGSTPCVPNGNNAVALTSLYTVSNTVKFLKFTPSIQWLPMTHVVVFVSRIGPDTRDDLTTPAYLENAFLQLER